MKRFSPRLYALGLALGALGAAAVLAASAYARPPHKGATTTRAAARPAQKQESGQPVIDWNQALLSIVDTPGAQPANIQPTRNFAILHAAIYDAVNAIDRTHEPYLISVRAPRDASETAAADAAAHTALVGLYPGQQSMLDADYTAELAKVADGPARDKGIRLGEQVASDLLAIRANDGSSVTPPPFVPGTVPGDYQPTPPNFPTPVFTAWGQVTPFVLDRGDQFRPAPPPALTSDAYAAAINEVQSLGSATSTTRTAEQTEIGKFWNPPIQNFWNQIAQTVALSQHSDLPTTARLFAVLNLSVADSAIAFYDAKYTYRLWRPVTAIRLADTVRQPEHRRRPELAPAVRQHGRRPVLPGRPQHDQRRRRRCARQLLRRPATLLDYLTRAARRDPRVRQLQRRRAGGRSQPHLLPASTHDSTTTPGSRSATTSPASRSTLRSCPRTTPPASSSRPSAREPDPLPEGRGSVARAFTRGGIEVR
jgi:hypothetical protein